MQLYHRGSSNSHIQAHEVYFHCIKPRVLDDDVKPRPLIIELVVPARLKKNNTLSFAILDVLQGTEKCSALRACITEAWDLGAMSHTMKKTKRKDDQRSKSRSVRTTKPQHPKIEATTLEIQSGNSQPKELYFF